MAGMQRAQDQMVLELQVSRQREAAAAGELQAARQREAEAQNSFANETWLC